MKLRRRSSVTYRTPRGLKTTLFYAAPVNYKDASGAWQPIDDTLVPSSGGAFAYRNKANSYTLELPSDLSSPLRFSSGGASLTISLVGAKAHGVVSGASERFANALPATTVTETAAPAAATESLSLGSLRAPETFSYELQPSSGLSARQLPNGAVEFVDLAGKAQLSILPPAMRDGAGRRGSVAETLTASGGGYTLTLRPDRAWLADSGRAWPVTIDPTVQPGGSSGADPDISITNATPDSAACLATTDAVGWDGSHSYRTLLDFGVHHSGIKSNAVILDAQLQLYLENESSTAAAPISVYNATKDYTCNATWNEYDFSYQTNQGLLWTTPGGDFNTGTASTQTIGGQTGTSYSWDVRDLVQRQVAGSDVGAFLVKQDSENVNNVLTFTGSGSVTNPKPVLTVNWYDGAGAQSYYKQLTLPIDDQASIGVNLATGNLLFQEKALHLNGTGLDLDLGHFYNSLPSGTGGSATWGYGKTSLASLTILSDGNVVYFDDTGAAHGFTKSGGSFVSPTGINATLTAAGGTLSKCSGAAYAYALNSHADGSDQYFDASGNLVAEADQNANTNCYRYDASGNLSSISDTQGRTTSFSYGSGLTTITDPGGRTYKYAYDATTGNLTSYTDPNGGVTSFGYDLNGWYLTSITDPLGRVWSIAYDTTTVFGRVTSITEPNVGTAPKFTFTYNGYDDPGTGAYGANAPYYVKVTDPLGHNWTYYYDQLGRITKATDPNGNSQQTTYDANSDVTTETDALGNATTYTYSSDGMNNLLSVKIPTGATEQLGYPSPTAANPYYPISHTDAQGNSWAYTYDPNGDLTQKSEGAGQNPINFTYNGNGTVATATDAKGTVTSYGYDANGNLTSITEPAPLHSESLTYDSVARVATATDGNGNTQTYTYDGLDRVTKIAYSDGSSVSYTYDKDGNMLSMVDSTGTTSFTYDGLNRLTKETLPSTKTEQYVYDAAGRMTQFTDTGNNVTKYGYDAANRLTSLTEPNLKVTNYGYDKNDNITSIAYPNGVTQTMGYDASQRLISIGATKGATQLTSFTYSYSKNGADTNLRQSVTGMVSGLYTSEATTYGYDTLNRLTSATSPSNSYSYAYDVNGNMTSKTVNGTTTTYGYNTANELTSINGGGNFSYDGNGNLTASPSQTSLVYNAKNQTTSITPSGGFAVSMGYSGPTQALRVAVGGTSEINSQLLGLIADTSGSSTSYYTRTPSGALTEERVSGGNYYYLYDGVGSVVGLTDSNGNLADAYKYEPYGNIAASSGAVTNPWRFADGYFDSQTGLYKFGARYYDPADGRWAQRDAVDNPFDERGWNRYAYGGDDPVNETDPSGYRYIRFRYRLTRGYHWFVLHYDLLKAHEVKETVENAETMMNPTEHVHEILRKARIRPVRFRAVPADLVGIEHLLNY